SAALPCSTSRGCSASSPAWRRASGARVARLASPAFTRRLMRYLFGLMALVAGCGDASNMTPPARCDLTNAAPTVEASRAGSETWGMGVHQVPASLTVPAGATLTVGACSRVEMAAGADLLVRGSLVVAGTADGPVDFVSSAASSPWGSIRLDPGGSA